MWSGCWLDELISKGQFSFIVCVMREASNVCVSPVGYETTTAYKRKTGQTWVQIEFLLSEEMIVCVRQTEIEYGNETVWGTLSLKDWYKIFISHCNFFL